MDRDEITITNVVQTKLRRLHNRPTGALFKVRDKYSAVNSTTDITSPRVAPNIFSLDFSFLASFLQQHIGARWHRDSNPLVYIPKQMRNLEGYMFQFLLKTLHRKERYVTHKILQIWPPFFRFSYGIMSCKTLYKYLQLLTEFYERAAMFVCTRTNAIDVIAFLKVWSSERSYNLVIHVRSYFASSLFLADSLKKVPDIQ